jgi:hypothetical protein
MGLGKTLVVIAAHALQRHTLPEVPQRVTAWTDAELEEYEDVVVGKDDELGRPGKVWPMYRGFKQANDGKGTVVPDNTVRVAVPAPSPPAALLGRVLIPWA